MSGITNFPTALDDDSSLLNVTDGVSQVLATHHNNLKEAIKAVEQKIGVYGSNAPTSIDYRLGHPTTGHQHNGASGQGPRLNPSIMPAPSGAVGSPSTLHDHLLDSTVHSASAVRRHVVPWDWQGSLPSGPSLGAPFSFGLTAQVESVHAQMRRSPSGATTALTVRIGPTALWGASVGLRPIFAPGTNGYVGASPNLQTYASGARVQVDVDTVGSSDPGQDLRLVFVFRE